MTRFAVRSDEAELMDAAGVDEADYRACLADLAAVNTATLARRPTLRWLARMAAGRRSLSVLDVACGHGDMLRAIRRWADRRGIAVALTGVDLNPRAAAVAREATPAGMGIEYRTGDVFATEGRWDVVVSSLFAHHLDDAGVVRFLRWMEAHATLGWFVNDLHRDPVPFHGFRLLSAAAGWHRFVRHDGPVSIARAFTRRDWARLLAEAGVEARVRWRFPYRLCVERRK